jgi:hypothetical protein
MLAVSDIWMDLWWSIGQFQEFTRQSKSVRLSPEEGLYGLSMRLRQVHEAFSKGHQGIPCDYNLSSPE